jgi:predicted O-methyltransferase YrrM
MTNLIKRILRNLPGVHALDRYLCYRYTGQFDPELYPRGHYYSPLPDLTEVQSRATVLFQQDFDTAPSIDLRPNAQLSLLAELSRYYEDFDWPQRPAPEYRFHLNQRYFCHADAIILYSMLRHLRPKHIIEVGSGFSSALMLDTDERHLGNSVRFTFVEPFPERVKSILRSKDRAYCQLVQDKVQNVPISIFQELEANDILFVDSSHVSKIGSDVNMLLFNVLPTINVGVVIHFHDILWPFEYPKQWILDGRAWNEAYLVRAFLQYNHHFEILLFNSFVAYAFRQFIEEGMPMFMRNSGGSLWIRKISQ